MQIVRHYPDVSSLKTAYLSNEQEKTNGVWIVSRETYLTFIKALFGHLYIDNKMVVSQTPEKGDRHD